MSYVFIQHFNSTANTKLTNLVFDGEVEARAHVQRLLDSSIDCIKVEMFEIKATANKVQETVWQ